MVVSSGLSYGGVCTVRSPCPEEQEGHQAPLHPAYLRVQVGTKGMAFSLGELDQHWVSLRLDAA